MGRPLDWQTMNRVASRRRLRRLGRRICATSAVLGAVVAVLSGAAIHTSLHLRQMATYVDFQSGTHTPRGVVLAAVIPVVGLVAVVPGIGRVVLGVALWLLADPESGTSFGPVDQWQFGSGLALSTVAPVLVAAGGTTLLAVAFGSAVATGLAVWVLLVGALGIYGVGTYRIWSEVSTALG